MGDGAAIAGWVPDTAAASGAGDGVEPAIGAAWAAAGVGEAAEAGGEAVVAAAADAGVGDGLATDSGAGIFSSLRTASLTPPGIGACDRAVRDIEFPSANARAASPESDAAAVLP